MLWISSPEDWHCKHQKSTPKMRNLSKWIKLAVLSNLMVILFGIRSYFWKLPEIKETIQETGMFEHKIHLCHYGLHYDKAPTASYFKLITNSTAKFAGKCTCKVDKRAHVLDWWGREEERALWRKCVWDETVANVFNAVSQTFIITDDDLSPPSIGTFPTDSRIKQKERLAEMKAKGLKPKKKKQIVEDGKDDCGDDLSGLGKDIVLYGHDFIDYFNDDLDAMEIYPTAETNTEEQAEPMAEGVRPPSTCQACWSKLNRNSPMHTRDPRNCSWPNVKPIVISCPTCKEMEGKYKTLRPANKGHT